MSSNTSKERGKKGSKFWIQTLVNLDNGIALTKEIQKVDNSIGNINWLSPLKQSKYEEMKTKQISYPRSVDFSFWPDNGPWWDAVGIDIDNDCVLLVEAKAHVTETKTKCLAKSPKSKEKIIKTMHEVHNELVANYSFKVNHIYESDVWVNKYYQLGNRLSFLTMLSKQGVKVKLVLLNMVNDITYKPTGVQEWENHYNEVFYELLGTEKYPDNVIMVNFDIG